MQLPVDRTFDRPTASHVHKQKLVFPTLHDIGWFGLALLVMSTTQTAKHSTLQEGLPSELLNAIVSHLTAKQLVRFRLVSRRMRDLVDNNLKSIIATRHALKRQELEGFVAHTVNFGKDLQFHPALGSYTRHRGLWAHGNQNSALTQSFATLWMCNFDGLLPQYIQPDPISLTLQRMLFHLIGALLDLHLKSRFNALRNIKDAMPSFTAFEETVKPAQLVFDYYKMNPAYLRRMYDDICASDILGGPGPGHVAEHSPRDPYDHESDSIQPPYWPLNNIACMPLRRVAIVRGLKEEWLCARNWVAATFDVPALPEVDRFGFGYCVESLWAYKIVKEAIDSGKQLDPLVRMVVVDELYIY